MIYEYAKYTSVGSRDNNEDSAAVLETENTFLAIVADGLGGHANGEVASNMAVNILTEKLKHEDTDEDALAYAILDASNAIRDAHISGHTTVAALWISGDYAVAAHVGDSRIYQFRNGKVVYQSIDHSIVQMAVLVGELKPDSVRRHKDRNKLFRVLGEENEEPKVDSTELTVQSGDRFLICSDGFWEPVTEADMLQTLTQTNSPEMWLSAMRQIVADAADPRQDNNTAICIAVR